MPRLLVVLVVLVQIAGLAAPALAQDAPRPRSRQEAVAIIADLRRIVTPNGIETTETVRIGGIDQWVSVRSRDVRNPVLLVFHGGPGWVTMPIAWYGTHGWEEYFTVIHWDQRGAGKTYAGNDPAVVDPTVTPERMIADAEEMVQWARQRFGKERIFVAGHSWGSLLGLTIAQKHPDWLHAYIGMAQGIDSPESERRGWDWTMRRAREAGNVEAVRALESLAPYAAPGAPPTVSEALAQRKWLNFFGGAVYRRTGAEAEGAAARLSPEYTDRDLQQMWIGQEMSVNRLFDWVMRTDLSDINRLETPLILFLGRHDVNVSSTVAAEWFETVDAPSKRLVWFEDSAHEMMVEEPAKVLLSLVLHARPIAERAGDVAPTP